MTLSFLFLLVVFSPPLFKLMSDDPIAFVSRDDTIASLFIKNNESRLIYSFLIRVEHDVIQVNTSGNNHIKI